MDSSCHYNNDDEEKSSSSSSNRMFTLKRSKTPAAEIRQKVSSPEARRDTYLLHSSFAYLSQPTFPITSSSSTSASTSNASHLPPINSTNSNNGRSNNYLISAACCSPTAALATMSASVTPVDIEEVLSSREVGKLEIELFGEGEANGRVGTLGAMTAEALGGRKCRIREMIERDVELVKEPRAFLLKESDGLPKNMEATNKLPNYVRALIASDYGRRENWVVKRRFGGCSPQGARIASERRNIANKALMALAKQNSVEVDEPKPVRIPTSTEDSATAKRQREQQRLGPNRSCYMVNLLPLHSNGSASSAPGDIGVTSQRIEKRKVPHEPAALARSDLLLVRVHKLSLDPCFEPIFCQLYLVDANAKRRISENFHFDFNSGEIEQLLPASLNQLGVVEEQSISKKGGTAEKCHHALFSSLNRYTSLRGVYLVARLTKVLQGRPLADCLEPYTATKKSTHYDYPPSSASPPCSDQQSRAKLLSSASRYCSRLGAYRMPIGWMALDLNSVLEDASQSPMATGVGCQMAATTSVHVGGEDDGIAAATVMNYSSRMHTSQSSYDVLTTKGSRQPRRFSSSRRNSFDTMSMVSADRLSLYGINSSSGSVTAHNNSTFYVNFGLPLPPATPSATSTLPPTPVADLDKTPLALGQRRKSGGGSTMSCQQQQQAPSILSLSDHPKLSAAVTKRKSSLEMGSLSAIAPLKHPTTSPAAEDNKKVGQQQQQKPGDSKKESWKRALRRVQPVIVNMATFYRQEPELLSDEELINYLAEQTAVNNSGSTIAANNKSGISTSTSIHSSIKLKTFPVRLCLELAVEDDGKANEEPTNESRHGGFPHRDVLPFSLPSSFTVNTSYRDLLFVYPRQVNLRSANTSHSSLSVSIRIQLMSGVDHCPIEAIVPPHQTQNGLGGQLARAYHTAVQYHNKCPQFGDEVKIQLPPPVTPAMNGKMVGSSGSKGEEECDYHHQYDYLLFTFHHISCKETGKTHLMDGLEEPIGYSWLPLFAHESGGHSLVQSGDFSLPISAERLPHGIHLLYPEVALPNLRWLDGHRPLFRVSLKVASTIRPQDAHILDFFNAYDATLMGPSDKKKTKKAENEVNFVEEVGLKRAIEGLVKAKPEALAGFLYSIIDKLLALMLTPPYNGSINAAAFASLCQLVKVTTMLLDKECDAHGRSALLAAYIHYRRVTPFTATTATSIPTTSSPAKKEAKSAEKRTALLETEHAVLNIGAEREISNPLHEQLIRLFLDSHAISIREGSLLWDNACAYSWFLLELTIKCMAEHLHEGNRFLLQRKQRFSESYLRDVAELARLLTAEIHERQAKDAKQATLQNAALAFFLRDLLSYADRGFVVGKLIKGYCDATAGRLASASPIGAPLGNLWRMKLEFLRIVCSHEHFLLFNLPFPDSILDTIGEVEVLESLGKEMGKQGKEGAQGEQSVLGNGKSSGKAKMSQSLVNLGVRKKPPQNEQATHKALGEPTTQLDSHLFLSTIRDADRFELNPHYLSRHYLLGVVLADFANLLSATKRDLALSPHEIEIRAAVSTAVELIYMLVAGHEADPRVVGDATLRVDTASLYFPLISIVVDNVGQLAGLIEERSETIHKLILSLFWAIKQLSPSGRFLAYLREQSTERLLALIEVLRISVSAFKLHFISTTNDTISASNSIEQQHYCSQPNQPQQMSKRKEKGHYFFQHQPLQRHLSGSSLGMLHTTTTNQASNSNRRNNRISAQSMQSIRSIDRDDHDNDDGEEAEVSGTASEGEEATETEETAAMAAATSVVRFRPGGTAVQWLQGGAHHHHPQQHQPKKISRTVTLASFATTISPTSSTLSMRELGGDGSTTMMMGAAEEEHVLRWQLSEEVVLEVLAAMEQLIELVETSTLRSSILWQLMALMLHLLSTHQPQHALECALTLQRAMLTKFPQIVFENRDGTPTSCTTTTRGGDTCRHLCLCLLRLASSAVANHPPALREQATASIYHLMRESFTSKHLSRPAFGRVRKGLTIALSTLVFEPSGASTIGMMGDATSAITTGQLDAYALATSLSALSHFADSETSAELKASQFPIQVRELATNLGLILADTERIRHSLHHGAGDGYTAESSTNKATSDDDETSNDPMLIDLMCRIAKGYQRSADLRITWLHTVANRHLAHGNFAEAGQCLLHCAALVCERLRHGGGGAGRGGSFGDDHIHGCLPRGVDSFAKLSANIWEEAVGLVGHEDSSKRNGDDKPHGPHHHHSGSNYDEGDEGDEDFVTVEAYTTMMQTAASLFEKAQLYEGAVEIYKMLQPLYEAQNAHEPLISMHRSIAENLRRVAPSADARMIEAMADTFDSPLPNADKRCFGTYFRVGFHGLGFGEELNGAEFIYKEPHITKLAEVAHRLERFYSSSSNRQLNKSNGNFDSLPPTSAPTAAKVIVLKDSDEINAVERGLDLAKNLYIQVTYVEPYFDLGERRERRTHASRNYNLRRFVYYTPFTCDGSKRAHGATIDVQYKRRTVLTTQHAFPYVKSRVRVVGAREQVVLTPIEVATDDVERRTRELAAAVHAKPVDEKILQMVLQGAIGTTVNQGPIHIARVFLSHANLDSYEHPIDLHQNRLRLALKDFCNKCDAALEKSEALMAGHEVEPERVHYNRELRRNLADFKAELGRILATGYKSP